MKHISANNSTLMAPDVKDDYNLLETAVRELSRRCDGAVELDGAGFNRFDARFGHVMAEMPLDEWSDRQLYATHRMVRKYKVQLAKYGVDFDSIPLPPRPSAPKSIKVESDSSKDSGRKLEYNDQGNVFYVSFAYVDVKKLLNLIKEGFKGRTWDGASKRWIANATSHNARFAATLVQDYDFTCSQVAVDAIARLSQERERFVSVTDGSFTVKFDFDPMLWNEINQIPLARFNRNAHHWEVRPDVSVVQPLLGIIAEHNLDAGDDVFEFAEKIVHNAIDNIAASRQEESDLEMPAWIKGTPYPFQLAGIEYALNNQRALIADEMGLGKTAQALIAAVVGGAENIVIACPSSVKYNWAKEIYNWFGDKWSISVIEGRKGDKKGKVTVNTWHGPELVLINNFQAKFLIVTYSVLPYHVQRLRERCDAFIADESHYLKNPKAKRSTAALSIARKAEFVFLLTGTPIKNRPVEFVHQLKVLGLLNNFGGAYKFKMRYCNPTYNGYGYDWNGATNLEELNMKLRSTCMVRRLKRDVMTELPPITHTEVPMTISNRAEYTRADSDPIRYIYEEALNDKELWSEIAALLRESGTNFTIKEMIEDRALEKMGRASRAEHLVRIALLRKLAGQGKMNNVIDWVRDFLESDQKLVVFAVHRAIQSELMEQFPDAAHVLGSDSGKVRMEQIDRFQTDPNCRLIVCSLYAASEGITLHAASHVAFIQQGWTPAEREQAIARAHRIGQDADNVTVWYLEAIDTIEQEIAALIQKKAGYLSASADGDIEIEEEYVSVLKQLVGKTTCQKS
jgi:hypothetical protein